MEEDEKLETSIDVPLSRKEKAIFLALCAEIRRKPAQQARILIEDFDEEHMKVKEEAK
jgi:hypothetical protein